MDDEPKKEESNLPTHIELLTIRRDGYMKIVEEIVSRAKGSTDLTADEIEYWQKQTELMVEIMRLDVKLLDIEATNRLAIINAAIIEANAKARDSHLN